MTEGQAIRLLLADDHPMVLEGLAGLLEAQAGLIVVAKAADGREAVALFRQHRPDVALLDIRMPVLDGIAATAAILAEFPDARVALMSAFDGDAAQRGLRAGARGYLAKDAPIAEVVLAIRRLHAGGRHLSPDIRSRLRQRVGNDPLTERELEVLSKAAAGLSNAEIGGELRISVNTVKTHVRAVMRKLQASSRTEAALIAIQTGLLRG